MTDEDENSKSNLSSFYLRFPRDEWMNALKYYRPVSADDEKENECQQINCSINN